MRSFPSIHGVDEVDVFDPKQELLRLPSRIEVAYAAAVVQFDKFISNEWLSAKNYPEGVESIVTCVVADLDCEELWQIICQKLMIYAGKRYPNT